MGFKHLHIIALDKFIPPFISYVNDNFKAEEHLFFFVNNRSKIVVPEYANIRSYNNSGNKLAMFLELNEFCRKAERIFIHGLFKTDTIMFFYFNKHYLSKVYWMMWGGDVYFYQPKTNLKEWIVNQMRIPVIKGIQNFVTIFKGDYDYLDQKFGLGGKIHPAIVYESNIFKHKELDHFNNDGPLKVMVGNSASDSNDHPEVFFKLKEMSDQNFEIISPLSYGNKKNKQRVIKLGKELFGERFHALESFMPLDEYNQMISKIDIVVFNHRRQQALGNIVTFLGYGKKVYLHPETSLAKYFKEKGVKFFDLKDFSFDRISDVDREINIRIIKELFNYQVYKEQLNDLFNK